MVQALVVVLLPPELLPLEEEELLELLPPQGNPVHDEVEVPPLELLLLEELLLLPLAEQLPELGTQLLPTGLLAWSRIGSQVAPLGQLWLALQSVPQ